MFSDKSTNVSVNGQTVAQGLLVMILASLTVYVILRIRIPADIISSAIGIDSMFRPVIETLPGESVFLGYILPTPSSASAISVGILLTVGTIILAFKFSHSGKWIGNQDMTSVEVVSGLASKRLTLKQLNSEKMTVFAYLVLFILFDTLLDAIAIYKVPAGAGFIKEVLYFIRAFSASFRFTSVLSEILLVIAFSMLIVSMAQVFGGVVPGFNWLADKVGGEPKPKRPSSGGTGSKSQPKRPPLPSRNQPPKASRIKSRPSPPPPTDQPFVMESRTAPTMNIKMPEPNFDE